ncbi:hypothetical protein AA106555_0490 [Neokomagataea thailandica NBRC 106555]|nr:hypothetical protein AA106555_0490 [Neokomagataea thailandica NBRC 106555]
MTSAPLNIILANNKKSVHPSTFVEEKNNRFVAKLYWAIPKNVNQDDEKKIEAVVKSLSIDNGNVENSQGISVDENFWKNNTALQERFLNWFDGTEKK